MDATVVVAESKAWLAGRECVIRVSFLGRRGRRKLWHVLPRRARRVRPPRNPGGAGQTRPFRPRVIRERRARPVFVVVRLVF